MCRPLTSSQGRASHACYLGTRHIRISPSGLFNHSPSTSYRRGWKAPGPGWPGWRATGEEEDYSDMLITTVHHHLPTTCCLPAAVESASSTSWVWEDQVRRNLTSQTSPPPQNLRVNPTNSNRYQALPSAENIHRPPSKVLHDPDSSPLFCYPPPQSSQLFAPKF